MRIDIRDKTTRLLTWLGSVALFLGIHVAWFIALRDTWVEGAASRWLLLGVLVPSLALSFVGMKRRWPFGAIIGLSAGALLGTLALSFVLWPTLGAGGARFGGMGAGQVAHLLLLLSMALPLLPILRAFRWARWVALPLGLWCGLAFAAGLALDIPLEDLPVDLAAWTWLPAWLHPLYVTVFLYFPLAAAGVIAATVVKQRAGRAEDAAEPRQGATPVWLTGLLWLALLVPAWALGWHVLRLNHVPTPIDLLVPAAPGVGTTTTILSDGSTVTLSTAGYHDLTDEQRVERPAWRILARGHRPADPAQPTSLWLTVLDERGRTVQGLGPDDLEVAHGDRRLGRFTFDAVALETPPSFAPPYIWIANSAESTVSKLSTRTGEELGRYDVAEDPSRTAVDLEGHVYVASRGAATLTKIHAAGCEGPSCVAFTAPTCEGPRGVAVDALNRVWVGGEWTDDDGRTSGCLHLHDPHDGALLGEWHDLDGRIYGLALDARGRVWGVLNPGNALVRVDRSGRDIRTFTPPDGATLYGIAVDERGRVWVANNSEGGVLRFDPEAEAWTQFGLGEGEARGVAADTAGNIWVADSRRHRLMRFDAAGGELTGAYDSGGVGPVGVAIDNEQLVWIVNQGSDLAVRVEPQRGGIVGSYPVGRGPYTYSDMTGYALNNFVARRGLYRVAFHATPLIVELTEPAAGAPVPTGPGVPLPLAVDLQQFDPDDPVVEVRYEVDGLAVATATEPPFATQWTYEALDEGPHRVRAVGTTASGATDHDEAGVQALLTFGNLAIELVRDGQAVDQLPRAIEFVVDSSGSMWGWAGDGTKVEIARAVLDDVVPTLPPDTLAGLRAYGHRSRRCDDSELLIPPAVLESAALTEAVHDLTPHGRTPIAHSLELAAADLATAGTGGWLGERMVVLVTDGIETCGGDPCAVAGALADDGRRVRANVVGFALGTDTDRSSLHCIADATGGLYVDADDAEGLADALARAVQVFYQVVDDQGRMVYMGNLTQSVVRVSTGTYRVRFGASASDVVMESEPFVLTAEQTVTVTLVVDGDEPPAVQVR